MDICQTQANFSRARQWTQANHFSSINIRSLFGWPQNAFVLPLHCCKTERFWFGSIMFCGFGTFDGIHFKCPFALRSTNLTINCAYLSADDKHNYLNEFILFLKLYSKIVQLQFVVTTTTEKYSKNFFSYFMQKLFFSSATKLFCSENLGTGEIMLICFMPFQRICTTSKNASLFNTFQFCPTTLQ